jgi:hypothetical protein
MFNEALGHWHELETKKAKELLQYIVDWDAHFRVESGQDDASTMLRRVRPDRNEAVLIVVGSGIAPQLLDQKAAEQLRIAINRKGNGLPFRWAAMVTDSAVLKEEKYTRCPIISVGGPRASQLTRMITESAEEDPLSSSGVHIQYATNPGVRRLALWGDSEEETAEAVERFLTSGLLDKFVGSIWEAK